MRRVTVESSSIDSVGYERNVLEVRFRNGGTYQYFGVPKVIHGLLMRAESKGGFFNRYVRDRYGSVRLRQAPPAPRAGRR